MLCFAGNGDSLVLSVAGRPSFLSSNKILAHVTGLADSSAGSASILVTRCGVKSGLSTIEIVPVAPLPNTSQFKLSQSSAGNRLEVEGARFSYLNSSCTGLTIELHIDSSVIPSQLVACKDTLLILDIEDTTGYSVATPIFASISHPIYGVNPSVQVAEIAAPLANTPVLSTLTEEIPGSVNMFQITGNNLGSAVADVRVYTHLGGLNSLLWTSIASTPAPSSSALSVTVDSLQATPLIEDRLMAIISVEGVKSETAQIAQFVPAPVIFASTSGIAKSSSGSRIRIYGQNFGSDGSSVAVVLSGGISTTVVSCTNTRLIVDSADTNAVSTGPLAATVTRNGGPDVSPGNPSVGVIEAAIAVPALTPSSSAFGFTGTILTIGGSNFGTNADDITVDMTPAGTPVLVTECVIFQTCSNFGF